VLPRKLALFSVSDGRPKGLDKSGGPGPGGLVG
jgi:hypothetical protein